MIGAGKGAAKGVFSLWSPQAPQEAQEQEQVTFPDSAWEGFQAESEGLSVATGQPIAPQPGPPQLAPQQAANVGQQGKGGQGQGRIPPPPAQAPTDTMDPDEISFAHSVLGGSGLAHHVQIGLGNALGIDETTTLADVLCIPLPSMQRAVETRVLIAVEGGIRGHPHLWKRVR